MLLMKTNFVKKEKISENAIIYFSSVQTVWSAFILRLSLTYLTYCSKNYLSIFVKICLLLQLNLIRFIFHRAL
jgi:hypothetical protein